MFPPVNGAEDREEKLLQPVCVLQERDGERRRLEELVEENMLLEIGQKQSMNESAHLGWELEQLTRNHDGTTNTDSMALSAPPAAPPAPLTGSSPTCYPLCSAGRKSLVHELHECVSSRVLKLEKENRELQASMDVLKEENHLLQEQQLHKQELGRENQSLSSKVRRNTFDPVEQEQNCPRWFWSLSFPGGASSSITGPGATDQSGYGGSGGGASEGETGS